MAAVERRLQDSLDADPPAAGRPMERIVGAGGKRLRPALVLLFRALAAGGDEDVAISAAVAVETLHAATLVHDDLIDASPTRRGVPSVSAREGQNAAVLVGDYHFAKAYREAARTGRQEIVELLATAVMRMCDGELDQQAARFNYRISDERYLANVDRKTGELMAAACESGAVAAGAGAALRRAAREYGLRAGRAFQIADDLLDYTGAAERLGKPAGHDLREGSATLPLLLARRLEARLEDLLREGEPLPEPAAAEVVEIVTGSGAIDLARGRARQEADAAVAALAALGEREAREALARLVAQMVDRSA